MIIGIDAMAAEKKSLMRSLGEFFGHIVKGAKTDPSRDRVMVNKTVEERREGSVVLRRTTIDEVEVRRPPSDQSETGG